MIQPKEIRIGNYYQGASRGNIKIVTWQTLRDLSEGKLNLLPIPLTEEILLKCGFTHKGNGFYEILGKFIELCNIGDEFYNTGFKGVSIGKIYFVHQLQNIFFSLCGEELTFKK